MTHSYYFILNSLIAKQQKIYKEIKQTLSGSSLHYQISPTEHPEHAIELAREAANNGFTVIVSIGGDGTLNEVLNGIMTSKRSHEVLLAVMPYGTANDFVKTIKGPKSISQLLALINQAQPKLTDVGMVEFTNHAGVNTSRYFLNASNIGIAAEIVEKVINGNKLLGANFAYFKAIAGAVLTYGADEAIIKTENNEWKGQLFNCTVSNGKFIGSGLCIAPEASIEDGMLNLSILGKFSFFDYLKFLPKIKRGENIQHPQLWQFTGKRITIENPVGRLLVEMDGEFVGYTKATFSISQQKVNIIPA